MTRKREVKPVQVFGSADVAIALDVTRSAVSMWLKRYDDTPTPLAITTDERLYWDADGLREWHRWRQAMQDREPAAEPTTNSEARRRKIITDTMRGIDS